MGKKVNELPSIALSDLTSSDLILVFDSETGTTRKASMTNVSSHMGDAIGTTVPNASETLAPLSGTAFYMSTVDPGSVTNVIATGGGYYLYSNATPANGSDVSLTGAEAAIAATSRVFQTVAVDATVAERATMFKHIMAADSAALANIETSARAYFHSLDLTLTEIGTKMALFAPALEASAAGSVELTLARLQSLNIPSSGGGVFDYTPNYVFNSSSHDSSYENYSSGEIPYDSHGIDKVHFNGGSFITIDFKDSASMTAWRSTVNTITLNKASGSADWEGTHDMGSAQEYSVSYSYNYVNYDMDGELTNSQMQDLADVAAASSGSPLSIEFNMSGQSTAQALGEQDVVDELILNLQGHLAKYPR